MVARGFRPPWSPCITENKFWISGLRSTTYIHIISNFSSQFCGALQIHCKASAMGVHILQRGDSARAPWFAYKLSFWMFHHPAGAICNYSGGQPAGELHKLKSTQPRCMTGIATLYSYLCDRTIVSLYFQGISIYQFFLLSLFISDFYKFAKP